MKEFIVPYADILAWCLMPNHFHIMVYVHTVIINSGSTTGSRTTTNGESCGMTSSRTTIIKTRDINKSIGIMLTSYTRAVNIQENRTGSLFKPHTKAENLTKPEGISPSFFGKHIAVYLPEKEYPQACFNYIHKNPVKAKMVLKPEDYDFSSYRDFVGLRNGKLINKERANEFGLFL